MSNSSVSQPPPLGPLIRLRPLDLSSLPAHPDLAQLQTGSTPQPELHTFVQAILAEASTFTTRYVPSAFSEKAAAKSSAPSTATVQLLAHDLPASALLAEARPAGVGAGAIAENWFARTSVHENKAVAGTASWDEFEGGLLDEHSRHEMEYTPDVYDAFRVLSWDQELGSVGEWEKVGLSVYEMCHHIPPPLSNRVFAVVIATAVSRPATGPPSFLVVQVPVDVARLPAALYSNGRHKTAADTAQKKKDITIGQYVSIERAELVDEGKSVKWQMATASDAKGVLPMWAQKMGVPGAVVKDVGLFIDWTGKRRKEKLGTGSTA